MFNKKFSLLLLAALTFGLAACNDNKGGDAPSDEFSIPVPAQEGKAIVFFNYVDYVSPEGQAGVALADLPEYISPFITGEFTDWGEMPTDGAKEMLRYEDTRIFYCYVDQEDMTKGLGYQITSGYNEASKVPSTKQGINWSYKCVFCASETFPLYANPDLVKRADNVYEAVSTIESEPMGFAKVQTAPVQVKNQKVTLKVELGEGLTLGENLEYVIKGSFDNWKSINSLGEADEDGVYTFGLGDQIAGVFEFCIGVRNKVTDAGMDDLYNLCMKTKGKAKGGTYTEHKNEGGEVTSVEISNITLTILSTSKDGAAHNLGTFTNPTYQNVYGQDGKVSGVKAYELPSNDLAKLETALTIVLHNSAETPVDLEPKIVGEIAEGWDTFVAMAVVTANVEWSYTIPADTLYLGKNYGFKFTTEEGWTKQVSLNGDNFNLKPEAGKTAFTVTGDINEAATKAVALTNDNVVYA